MKLLAVLIALTVLISVQALTDEQKQKLRMHFKVCQEETGAANEYLGRIRKGDFDFDDAKVKEWFFCVFKRSDIMTADGKFMKDVALSKVEPEDRDNVGKAIDKCLMTKDGNNIETSWIFAKCYHKERPNHNLI